MRIPHLIIGTILIVLLFMLIGQCAAQCNTCPNQGTCGKLPAEYTIPPLAPIACANGQCAVPLKTTTPVIVSRVQSTQDDSPAAKPVVSAKARWATKCGRRGPRRFLRRVGSWRPVAWLRGRSCCR